MAQIAPDSTETQDLLARLRAGDRAALDPLLSRHRSFLRRLIDLRLDLHKILLELGLRGSQI